MWPLNYRDRKRKVCYGIVDMDKSKEMKIALGRANQRIEELERLVKNLSYQAFVDDKTGLPNYRAFCQRIDQLLAEAARGRVFSLVMVDIDHFKRVNDTFGHDVGDEVLRHVAGLLHGASRQVDFVGRYGGEEFCMLLPEANIGNACEVAERARTAISERPFGCINVTASFGVASYAKDMSIETLLKAADAALYGAKGNGRNCVVGWNA